MGTTATITKVGSNGNMRMVTGTFTTAAGDTAVTLAATDHGLNFIASYNVDLSGVGAQKGKVTISSGTITASYDDTLGYSGNFTVVGK